ncbi:MAG: NUDIX domain-containing protein [Pseudomonadota bacterium]
MSLEAPRPHVGVSISVFRDGRVLLATRTKPPYAGLFTLPGGHVEAGEKAADAALRELEEETGVKAALIGFNQYVEIHAPPDAAGMRRHFVILSFVGTWLSGEGTPGPEAGEILWTYPDEIAQLKTSPQLIEVVANARKVLMRHMSPD